MSKYRSYFTDKGFLLSVLLGMLALGVSLIVSTIAIRPAKQIFVYFIQATFLNLEFQAYSEIELTR